jgi:hypothetical protein
MGMRQDELAHSSISGGEERKEGTTNFKNP